MLPTGGRSCESSPRRSGTCRPGSRLPAKPTKQLGVPKALGMKTEACVNQRLGGYVKLAVEDRRAIATNLVSGGMSKRAVGEVLGVDHAQVVRDLKSGANAPSTTNPQAEKKASGANAPIAIAPRRY